MYLLISFSAIYRAYISWDSIYKDPFGAQPLYLDLGCLTTTYNDWYTLGFQPPLK